MPVWALIAIQIVASLLLAALAPKPKPPDTKTAQRPIVSEGDKHRKAYGTVWIDDPMVLAYRQVGTQKIKSKGGKK